MTHIEKHKDHNVSRDDGFARLYEDVESNIEAALQKAELASREKNKALAVALNAEIRRTKAKLLEEVPKLQRLAVNKVKGLSIEELAARSDLVLALPDKIQAVPDGAAMTLEMILCDEREQSSQFKKEEYEMCLVKKDQGLDMICEGLDTLKNMARDMNEVLDRQVPLMDKIDTKLRSGRNFFIDIVLMCIILGIAAYLYKYIKK
ncbi:hypothetical protein K2173_019507 [Erythroxylum novogranatense]|uniref:t-SNARE coiled-coil homology domain-containing protein n=1 Tax=Erythroxylum novogranatense TaxID=1862640 RepID=A0AAV8UEU0_9ROSI|nr:hypothetical protein K2173_019507 [Erythroxylum novogranatense]